MVASQKHLLSSGELSSVEYGCIVVSSLEWHTIVSLAIVSDRPGRFCVSLGWCHAAYHSKSAGLQI